MYTSHRLIPAISGSSFVLSLVLTAAGCGSSTASKPIITSRLEPHSTSVTRRLGIPGQKDAGELADDIAATAETQIEAHDYAGAHATYARANRMSPSKMRDWHEGELFELEGNLNMAIDSYLECLSPGGTGGGACSDESLMWEHIRDLAKRKNRNEVEERANYEIIRQERSTSDNIGCNIRIGPGPGTDGMRAGALVALGRYKFIHGDADPSSMVSLGKKRWTKFGYASAVADLQEAATLSPDWEMCKYYLAWATEELGKSTNDKAMIERGRDGFRRLNTTATDPDVKRASRSMVSSLGEDPDR